MKIMIVCAMEGCAGVRDFDEWTAPGGRSFEAGRRLLTGEVNAAVSGLFEGGATECVVADLHPGGAVDPEALDPGASLLHPGADAGWPFHLNTSYDGIACVGLPARPGEPYSHLSHLEGFACARLHVCGHSVGRFGMMALCAMELGLPTILASGDQALADEVATITPGVELIAVKRGLETQPIIEMTTVEHARARLGAVHCAPQRSRILIREGARSAARRLRADRASFSYPSIPGPPYVREARFLAEPDKWPWAARDEHPTSIAELLNLPWTAVPIEG